jgi:hypothetical protein
MHCDSEILQNCSPLRNATPLIGPDFISRCTEIVKYYKIVSLKKGHTLIRPLSPKASPLFIPDSRCTERVKYN